VKLQQEVETIYTALRPIGYLCILATRVGLALSEKSLAHTLAPLKFYEILNFKIYIKTILSKFFYCLLLVCAVRRDTILIYFIMVYCILGVEEWSKDFTPYFGYYKLYVLALQ